MPIEPPRSPIVDAFYNGMQTPTQFQDMTNEDISEMQKEQENRLIGSMMIQSIFLALAIMLYEAWEFGRFDQVWQSAVMYGMLAFTFQASLYLLYRSVFEDSRNYRRQIKRLKTKNRSRMAQIKFEVEKQRTEWMLDQQIRQFESNAMMAQSDGVVSPQEQVALQQQYAQVQQAQVQQAQQMKPGEPMMEMAGMNTQYDIAALAKSLGLDRHRVGPIPISPLLTVTPAPLEEFQIPQLPRQETLDLDPNN